MHGAWLSFSDAPLLDNAELHIEDNERVCLVGRNGAGKSTLMKILNREQGLDDGRIIYEQDLIVARLQQDPPRNVPEPSTICRGRYRRAGGLPQRLSRCFASGDDRSERQEPE
jgi:ATPase subunit of ABC transporter with duplicated ATPase domains